MAHDRQTATDAAHIVAQSLLTQVNSTDTAGRAAAVLTEYRAVSDKVAAAQAKSTEAAANLTALETRLTPTATKASGPTVFDPSTLSASDTALYLAAQDAAAKASSTLSSLQIQQSAVGNKYQSLVGTDSPVTNLSFVQTGAISGDDKRSNQERFGLLGLLAGLVVGPPRGSTRRPPADAQVVEARGRVAVVTQGPPVRRGPGAASAPRRPRVRPAGNQRHFCAVTGMALAGRAGLIARGGPVDRRDLPAYLLCMLGAVLAMLIAGNSSQLGLPIGPDHPLEAAAVLLLLLDPRALRERRVRFQPLFVACAVMVAVAAWSAWDAGTLTTSLGFYQLLDTLAVPYLGIVLGPLIFSTPARRDLLLRLLVVIGLYLSLTAFFEMLGPHQLVFPRYIVDPNVGLQYGRARGPFIESEADGLAMCFCGMAAAFAFVRLPHRWRLVAALTALLCGFGVLLSLTRSVWIGTGLGVVLVGLAEPRLRRRLPVVAGAAAASIAIALAEIPSLQTLVTQRAGNQRSLWDRENVNAAALRIIHDRPLSGVGWANYVNVSRDWVRQAATYPITNIDIGVHNVFLSRAAELGHTRSAPVDAVPARRSRTRRAPPPGPG